MSSTLATVEELPRELHNGDSMTRDEFHRVYSTIPKHVKAELIEGIVYLASPLWSRNPLVRLGNFDRASATIRWNLPAQFDAGTLD